MPGPEEQEDQSAGAICTDGDPCCVARVAFLALALSAIGLTSAFAQALEPQTTRQLRFGSVEVEPYVVMHDIGIDSNVYNEEGEAIKDFTFIFTPVATATLRGRRATVTARSTSDFLYFQQQTGERSINTDLAVTLEVPLRRLRPFADMRYWNTRERATDEIDARARRTELSGGAGVEVPLGQTLSVVVRGDLWRLRFARGASFDSRALDQQLDRETQTVSASLRYKLTPLTTLVGAMEESRTRFSESTFRNSDVRQVTGGVEFNPKAILGGAARFGYQRFRARDEVAPDYTGAIAAGTLTYRIAPTTSLIGDVERNVGFSYYAEEPIYVRTGLGLTVAQELTRQWDVALTVQRSWHQYRRLQQGADEASGHDDGIFGAVVGIGYDIGPRTRATMGLAYNRRRSDIPDRGYSGVRVGFSMAYGF